MIPQIPLTKFASESARTSHGTGIAGPYFTSVYALTDSGSKDNAVVRALTSDQCGLGSNPLVDAIYGSYCVIAIC